MRKHILILVVGIWAGISVSTYARDEGKVDKALTQEQFAVEMVRDMRLDGALPTAALPADCVELLERLGIAPLNGWNNKALLAQEDYLVILAKARGKESMLHERAVAVEDKNRDVIDKKWQESFERAGRWVSLDELMSNKDYFPDGPLKSPYGLKYEDRDRDHKVDPHQVPVVGLIRLREFFSN